MLGRWGSDLLDAKAPAVAADMVLAQSVGYFFPTKSLASFTCLHDGF